MVSVTIDTGSGFCFGVTTAINKAEEELKRGGKLYCLGDIVHNSEEVDRLNSLGLSTISHEDLSTLHNARVLLRAHGEPPSTYRIAAENSIEIIDATCPVVLQLQRRVKRCYDENSECQIVIYGKIGHAEVNGLVGQTDGNAIVVENLDQLSKLDFSKDTAVFSQTTKSIEGFQSMCKEIAGRLKEGASLKTYDTICRQVANRADRIKQFARSHDAILFVSGSKSSNGRVLFNECKSVNPNSFLISNENEIDLEAIKRFNTVGICGATSTPRWLMERVKSYIE